MKKFLLKIALCATMILALGGVTTPLFASADEGVETPEISTEITDTDIVSSEEEITENDTVIVEETETSKWFDETIKPLLLEYGAEVVAFSSVVFLCLKKLREAKCLFDAATEAVTKSNKDNESTSKAVKKLKEEMRKEMEAVTDALKEIREGLEAKVVDVDEVVHKLLDVEKLAYGNNAHLVSNGTAKRIAEVIGNGKKAENENKE